MLLQFPHQSIPIDAYANMIYLANELHAAACQEHGRNCTVGEPSVQEGCCSARYLDDERTNQTDFVS